MPSRRTLLLSAVLPFLCVVPLQQKRQLCCFAFTTTPVTAAEKLRCTTSSHHRSVTTLQLPRQTLGTQPSSLYQATPRRLSRSPRQTSWWEARGLLTPVAGRRKGVFGGGLGASDCSQRYKANGQLLMAANSVSAETNTTDAAAGFGGARSVNWPLWYVLPIAPYQKRKTIMKEVVPGKVWTFDQLQGILYVIVPVRMTVVKLENSLGGGLFVYAPVAPTGECLSMIRALEEDHGPVKHIVLGTLGLEHKVFAGPFAQRFSQAQVWYNPGQYSFPVGLPLSWLGFGGRPTRPIPAQSSDAPWAADLDHAVLGPFFSKDGSGGYGETAFFHKATKTLLVTDMVVKVEDEVPDIVAQDPRPLLFHARDNAYEQVENTNEVLRKGWRRIVQFALTFQPSSLEVVELKKALFEDAPKSKMKELGWGGLFPFEWKNPTQDLKSFDAMKGGLLVAPILQVLLLNRDPEPVLDWADRVASWPFKRVIPCHLANDIAATPQDFRKAFRFLEKGRGKRNSGSNASPFDGILSLFGGASGAGGAGGAQPLPEDLQFLRDAEKTLVDLGTLFPAAEPVDRSGRR